MLWIDLWRGVKTIGTSPGEGGTARALSIREPRNETILLLLYPVEDLRSVQSHAAIIESPPVRLA